MKDIINSKDEQKVYIDYIYPAMDEELSKMSNREICNALVFKSIRGQLVENIHFSSKASVEKNEGNLDAFKNFTQKKLNLSLIQELERRAIFEGNFSSKQIEGMRKHRSAEEKSVAFQTDLIADIKLLYSIFSKNQDNKKNSKDFKDSYRTSVSNYFSKQDLQISPYHLNALLNITPSSINNIEPFLLVWTECFDIIIKNLTNNVKLDEEVDTISKKALTSYIDAKSKLLHQKSFPSNLKDAILKHLDLFESKLTQETKEYVDHEIRVSKRSFELINDIIFHDDVLEDVLNGTSTHSLLSSHEKKGLMELTKFIDKTRPLQISLPLKNEMCNAIESDKDLSIYEKNKMKKMINTGILNLLNNDEKEKLKKITDGTKLDSSKKNEILNLINSKSSRIIDKEEKKAITNLIKLASKDPSFLKRLKKLESNIEPFSIRSHLKAFPIFIQNLIENFFGKKDEFEGIKKEGLPLGIEMGSIRMLSLMSTKISKLDKYDHAIKKAEKIMKNLEKTDSKISETDKLTYRELSLLNELVRGNVEGKNTLDLILLFDLGQEGTDLCTLKELFVKGESILEKIEEKIRPGLLKHYDDGDMIAFSAKKKQAWSGELKGEEYSTSLLTNGLTHGGKLFKKANGSTKDIKLSLSDISNLAWSDDEVGLYDLLISDVYSLDVTPLFDSKTQQLLQKIYGDDWKNIVSKKYQEIENDIHSSIGKHFKKIENNFEKRKKARLADYAMYIQPFTSEKIKGHYRRNPQDFNEIHKKFFEGRELEEKHICSEFVSQSTLAAMIEMNRFLSTEIATKYFNYKTLDEYKTNVHQTLKQKYKNDLSTPVSEYLSGKRYYGKDSKITVQAEKELKIILKLNGLSQSRSISLFV